MRTAFQYALSPRYRPVQVLSEEGAQFILAVHLVALEIVVRRDEMAHSYGGVSEVVVVHGSDHALMADDTVLKFFYVHTSTPLVFFKLRCRLKAIERLSPFDLNG